MSQRAAPTGVQRAYGLLKVNEADDAKRTFTGIASTVSPDRMDDVVEAEGAKFKLPLPFLYQHDSRRPVGWITEAKIGKSGIDVAGRVENLPDGPASLRDRLDVAWAELKTGLVRGLSIGFNPLEWAYIKDSYGIHYTLWEWFELSMVTIPANAEATILTVKQFDSQSRAALGLTRKGVPLLVTPPGASGIRVAHPGAVKLIPR